MVETIPFVLEAEIVINIPTDILKNGDRLESVKEGIKKALTKGLYEQALVFEIRNMSLKPESSG
jgi:hypothetical protein